MRPHDPPFRKCLKNTGSPDFVLNSSGDRRKRRTFFRNADDQQREEQPVAKRRSDRRAPRVPSESEFVNAALTAASTCGIQYLEGDEAAEVLASWFFGKRRWLLLMHSPVLDLTTTIEIGMAVAMLRIRFKFDAMLTHMPCGDAIGAVSALKANITQADFVNALREMISLPFPEPLNVLQDVISMSPDDPSRVWPDLVQWAGGGGDLTPEQEEAAKRLLGEEQE